MGTLGDRAYEALRRDIVDLVLQPGTHLSEGELSTSLGVSRTPVREALHRLAVDGLVESESGRGTAYRPSPGRTSRRCSTCGCAPRGTPATWPRSSWVPSATARSPG
ncbi:MAG: GntR family transcriptional regulator [Actinomycetota bacterium]